MRITQALQTSRIVEDLVDKLQKNVQKDTGTEKAKHILEEASEIAAEIMKEASEEAEKVVEKASEIAEQVVEKATEIAEQVVEASAEDAVKELQAIEAQEAVQAVAEAVQAEAVAQGAIEEAIKEAVQPKQPPWVNLGVKESVQELEPLHVSMDLDYKQDTLNCDQSKKEIFLYLSTFVPEWSSIFQESIQDTFHKNSTNFVLTRPDENNVGRLTFDVLNNDKQIVAKTQGKKVLKRQKPVNASELMQFLIDFPLEDTVQEGLNNGWVIPSGGLSFQNSNDRCGHVETMNIIVQ